MSIPLAAGEESMANPLLAGEHFTYTDYLQMDDDVRAEVIRGGYVMTPSPGRRHQEVLWKLARRFDDYLKENPGGKCLFAPFDVVLADDIVLQPDLIYISPQRQAQLTEACMQGAPDLVVEVLSPASVRRDRMVKSEIYFKCGVREYWLVDPEAHLIEVFARGENDWQRAGVFDEKRTPTSTILPELRVEVKTVLGDA